MEAATPGCGTASAGNQQAGRWQPGQSGNPQGRRQGSRNRATLMLEQLIEGEAEAVVRSVIEQAKAGDLLAAKVILDRVLPPRRSRLVHLDIPPIQRTADIPGKVLALFQAVADGQITPEEAVQMTKLLAVACAAAGDAGFGAAVDLLAPDTALGDMEDADGP